MDSRTINLARESFASFSGRASELAERFYQNLFTRQAALRPFFPADLTEQKKQLPQIVQTLLTKADKLDTLAPTLRDLGKQYAQTGALEVHYTAVARTFVDTLREMSGAAWQARYSRAWLGVLDRAIQIMLRGAAGKPAATPAPATPSRQAPSSAPAAAASPDTSKPRTGKPRRAA